MTIQFKKFFLLNFLKFVIISYEIEFIVFRNLFFSEIDKILFSTKESKISIAIKPHLASPANGKVPYFLQFSTCQ